MADSVDLSKKSIDELARALNSGSGGATRGGGLTGAVSKITELSDNDRDKELNFHNLRLKFNRDYQKVLKDINDKEKLALKMQDEHEKYLLKKSQYDKAQLDYVKKAAELEKLKLNTARLQGAEKKKNEKYILQEEKILNEIIEKNKDVLTELEKQLDVERELKDIEHDLAGLNRDKNNTLKKTTKSTETISKVSQSIFDIGSKILMNALSADSAVSKMAANYALSRRETENLKRGMAGVAFQTQAIGIGFAELVQLQGGYTDTLGRSVMLTNSGAVAMANLSVSSGLGLDATSRMVGEMDIFNMGVASSAELMGDLMQSAKNVGISSSVASKSFATNMKAANTYNFKDGLDSVKKMTVFSGMMKINMANITAFSDAVSSVEGSLTVAAKLQNLGGQMSQFADPLTLMNQGMTDMEGLTKTYSKMLSGVVSINKETGKMIENPYEKIRVKSFAEATGGSFEDAMTAARTAAKRSAISQELSITPTMKNADEDTKNLIASLATMENGKWGVNVRGTQKNITELNKADLEYIKPDKVQIKEVAQNTLGLLDVVTNGFQSLLNGIIGQMLPLMNDIAGYILSIENFILGKVTGSGERAGGLIPNKANVASAASSGIGATLGSFLMANGGKLLGSAGAAVGAGAGLGGIFSAIGDTGGSFGHRLGVGAGSAIGGLIGGGLGTMIAPGAGTMALGMGGSYLGEKAARWMMGDYDKANDLYVPASGTPIVLNTKDQAFIAAKDGGAIQSAINSRAGEQSVYETVSPTQINNSYSRNNNNNIGGGIKLDLSGDITLKSDSGSSTKIDASALVRNQMFVRELSRLITKQLSIDKNGGTYSGPLTNDSF